MSLIEHTALHEATRNSYLNYALSVITSRALPDVRDGLKPVQRRILYGMFHNLKLYPDGRYRKSAAVIGEVMAKYHPHGDSSIYDAMVRMAQNFSLLHMLVDGQGNFGSIDGDSAAAMRYTECKLTPLAVELLSELRQRTVDYRPNYDGQHMEPVVLPAQFPQLLVNGTEGIAVGMATRIPPHNLREVIDAAILLIDKPDATCAQLHRKLKGPDFPLGGTILNTTDELRAIYETGSGSVRIQGTWEFHREGRQGQAIITTIPYAINKSTLVEKMGGLIAAKKLPQLIDIRDESTDVIRIVMDIRRSRSDATTRVDAEAALAYLFKHTPLQTTFPVNLTCLIPTENSDVCRPTRANLLEILQHWLEFRCKTVRRRLEYELEKLRDRLHILEALSRVFDVLDEIIAMIRASEGRRDAHEKLIARFAFTDIQADAILDLRLYKLAKLEIHAILEELEEKQAEADRIEALLSSQVAINDVVRQELLELRRLYGQKRRTTIGTTEAVTYQEDAYIVSEDAYLIVTREGWIKRQNSFSSIDKIRIREGDDIACVALGNTRKTVTFFTDQGGAYVLRLDVVPATTGYGEPIQRQFKFNDGERVIGIAMNDARSLPSTAPTQISLTDDTNIPPFGVAISRKGRTVRFSLHQHTELSNRNGRRFMRLEKGDAVLNVFLCAGDENINIASKHGRALSFPVADINLFKGAGKGVTGIKLQSHDSVYAAQVTTSRSEGVTVETPRGRTVVVNASRYLGSRGGRGKVVIKRGEFSGWTPEIMRFDRLQAAEEE